MTESMRAVEPLRRNSRIVRDPGTRPKIVVAVSYADSRSVGETARVQVRCGPCGKRLYDVAISEVFLGADAGFVEDDETLIAIRRCPSCRRDNEGRVTRQRGRPYAGRDALAGPWRCACGQSLGKIDPARARIAVTCECGDESHQSAIEAIAYVYHADA